MKKLLFLLFIFSVQGSDFAIQAPTYENPTNQSGQVRMYYLPKMDNFTANVGVQKQVFAGSLEDYMKLTLQQFEKMKFTVISQKVTKNYLLIEYSGKVQNRDLRFYSKSFTKEGVFYLATGTAPSRTWDLQGPALKASVDSFVKK